MSDTPQSLEGLSPTEKRMLLAQLLQKRVERGDVFPMSEGQKGLWLLHHLEPQNPAYNISFSSHLVSRLNVAAFQEAIHVLVARHASLRTTFGEQDGELLQRVHDDMPVALEQVDASSWVERELHARIQAAIAEPFDLATGPLLRIRLYTRAPDDHVLLCVAHHIAMDFWSLVVLLMEVRTVYPATCEGREPNLPRIEHSYDEFVRWQRKMLGSERGAALANYWQEQLAGAPHVLELPVDRPRSPRFSNRAGIVPCNLTPDLTAALNELAAAEKVTLYSILMAAFQIVLGRYSGQRDFLVGTPFVGRSRPGFEQTVGYFVNMLPIRATLSDKQTFRQLLQQVGASAVEALSHQDYPFPVMVDQMHVARDPSRPPLVQVSFTLERAQRQEEAGRARFLFPNANAHLNVGGLLEETYYVEQQTCHHELELVLEQSGGTVQGLLCYCADLFDQRMMERFVDRYRIVLRKAVEQPDVPLAELDSCAAAEREQVVTQWNQTSVDFPRNVCLHHLVEQQVDRTPDALAIATSDRDYSYRELDAWANRLAGELIAHGVGPGGLVVICLDRSAVKIALILATFKAGGACVPVDPSTPPERLQRMLDDTAPVLVFGQDDNVNRLRAATNVPVVTPADWSQISDQDHDPGRPASSVSCEDLAYVIYTSGSTGQPKGVMIEHRAICNTIQWRCQALPIRTSDRILLMLPCFFDASFSVVFSTIAQGGCLALLPAGEERNPTALLELCAEKRVSILPAPPRLLQVLIDHPLMDKCHDLRQVQTGGESMSPELCQRIVSQLNVPLVNMYGPTEAAVETSYWICQPGAQPRVIPIGRPISNVQTYVLDARRQPSPIGVPGELYIGGAGLARGYLNDIRQTNDRFLPHPFDVQDGARVYRTGDLCRWLDDGNLEFLGRVDQQVKLRGYRIELTEIEHALSRLAPIQEAAAAVHINQAQEPQLVAYIVLKNPDERLEEEELRRDLRERLPHYMVPALIETVGTLPRTASGKLDRQRLPSPRNAVRPRCEYVAPRTALEQYVVDSCQKILKVDRIGMRDSFYELGGTSIQGATLLAMLQDDLGQRIQTTAMFDLTEIGDLTAYLASNYPEAVELRFGSESVTADAESVSSRQVRTAINRTDAAPQQPGELIVPIQPQGGRTPLFMVHPPGGIVICYQPLARHLGAAQPLYGIRARGLHGESELPADLESMAEEYVAALQSVQPAGPYMLGGWSLGGVVAYEMAQQLQAMGQTVQLLLLLDTTIPQGEGNQQYLEQAANTGVEYGLDMTLEELGDLGPEEQLPYLFEHARKLGVIDEEAPEELVQQVLNDLKRLFHAHLELASRYRIRPYRGRIALLRPSDAPVDVATTPDRGWRQLAENVDVHFVPGQHHSMVKDPHVKTLAKKLAAIISQ